MWSQFDCQTVHEAYRRIRDAIHRTPVFTSESIDRLVVGDKNGCRVYFKAECMQKTGSFKARAAMNAMRVLKEKNVTHVVTHSSGNFGQALAYAAQKCGNIGCTVVVPSNAAKVKVDAIKSYNADVIYSSTPFAHDRVTICDRIAQDSGAYFVHPYDNFDVIAGQGTIALEFLEQVPNLDAILVPVGGGGMLSGVAAWTKHVNPKCKVFAVEPYGKHLTPSLSSGRALCEDHSNSLDTLADGMRIPGIGERCFPILVDSVEKEIFTVTDDEIVEAMKLIYQRLKLLVEPSGATSTAALLGSAFQEWMMSSVNNDHDDHDDSNAATKIRRIGVILSGGNVDLDNLPWMMMTK